MNTPDFDETTHTYTVDGVVYPSVTTILDEAGFIDARWWKPEDALKGRRVHTITALHDKGELDDAKVPDDLRGYLESWKAYLGLRGELTAGVTDIKTGEPLAWHDLQVEAYLILATPVGLRAVDDSWSTSIERRIYHTEYRFAGTIDRLGLGGADLLFARCVYLRADGGEPLVIRCYNPDARNAFLAALSVYSWKMKHGLLRKDDDDNN